MTRPGRRGERFVLLFFLFLFFLPVLGREAIEIKGDYLLYSYDHNYIFGKGHISLKAKDFTIQGESLDIDTSKRSGVISGHCTVAWGDRVSSADRVELTLFDLNLRLIRFASQVETETLKSDQNSVEKGMPVPGFPVISLAELKKSLLYFLCTEIRIKSNFSVYGYAVTVFVEGMQSVALKKFKMEKGVDEIEERFFNIDKIWYYDSQGAVLNFRLNLGKKFKQAVLKSLTSVSFQYDLFNKGLWDSRVRVLVTSTHTFDLSPRTQLLLNLNYNSRNMFNAAFHFKQFIGTFFSGEMFLDFRQPYLGRQELWLRLNSAFNFKAFGSFQANLGYERENQYTADLAYQNQLLPGVTLALRRSQSKLLFATDMYNELNATQVSLSYTNRLFNLSSDYSLNHDLLNDQTQSSPQVRLTLTPFRLYGGLIGVNICSAFVLTRFERAGRVDSIYHTNLGINLESDTLEVTPHATFRLSLAAEQFIDQDPRNNYTSAGVVLRAKQAVFSLAELELLYNYQVRRQTTNWLIPGTTSQDVSALVRLSDKVQRVKGWLSLSYNSKIGKFTTGYLDGVIDLVKNWQFQTQLNYDFFFKNFNYNLYLIRRAGRISLRLSYRSLSRQFLIEIVPGG